MSARCGRRHSHCSTQLLQESSRVHLSRRSGCFVDPFRCLRDLVSWGLCSLEKHTSFYILVVDLSFIVCQSSVRDPDCVRKRQRRNGAEIAIVAVMRCTVTEPMLMLRLMIRELAS